MIRIYTDCLYGKAFDSCSNYELALMDSLLDGRVSTGKSKTMSGFTIQKVLRWNIAISGHELTVLNTARAMVFEISPASCRFMQEFVPKLFADLFANRRAGPIAWCVLASLWLRSGLHVTRRERVKPHAAVGSHLFFCTRGCVSDPRPS